MFAAAPAPAPEDALAADPAAERAGRHGRVLAELVEIGMDLARLVRERALEAAEAADGAEAAPARAAAEAAKAFSHIARAVRLSLALEDRLAGARRVQVERDLAEVAARRAAAEPYRRIHIDAAKDQVHALVGQVIEAEAAEREAERLFEDLDELLDEAGHGPGLEDRPIGEWVASVCRDLGLEPDWSLWAREKWAVREAKAGAAGSPYAAAGRAEIGSGPDPGLGRSRAELDGAEAPSVGFAASSP